MNVPNRTANDHIDAAAAQDRNAETCGNAITRRAYEAAAAAHRHAARALYHLESPAQPRDLSLLTFNTFIQFHAASADAAAHTADGRMSGTGKLEARVEAEAHRDGAKHWADVIVAKCEGRS